MPKIHILVEHVPEFLEQYNGLGLDLFSEQVYIMNILINLQKKPS